MKKYIYMMLVVLTAGFASCSNDDIPMEEVVTKKIFETTFIVDPSGVVESYRFETYPGHLSRVPEGAELRLRILIYDSNGEIVDVLTQKQSNYQSVWSVKKNLEAGTYSALVISDVININDPNVKEYWTLTDYEKFNDVKLEKNLDWLGYQKEILGMCHLQFLVDSLNSSISLELEPAGAACYYYLANFDTEPITLWLRTDMEINYVFWDSSNKLKVNRELSDYHEFVLGGANCPVNSEGFYYVYLLPYTNQHFRFYGQTDETQGFLGEDMYIADIKAGEQYFFMCYFSSLFENYAFTGCYNVTGKNFEEWIEDLSKQNQNSRKLSVHHEMSKSVHLQNTNNAVYIKDLIKR